MKAFRSAFVALVATLPLLVVACEGSVSIGGRTLDGDEVEEDMLDGLEEEVGERPDSIDCPDEIDVEEGETFECTLTVGEDELTVVATMTDDEGAYEYEVTE